MGRPSKICSVWKAVFQIRQSRLLRWMQIPCTNGQPTRCWPPVLRIVRNWATTLSTGLQLHASGSRHRANDRKERGRRIAVLRPGRPATVIDGEPVQGATERFPLHFRSSAGSLSRSSLSAGHDRLRKAAPRRLSLRAGRVNAGYSTILSVLPSEGIVITVMTNTDGDPKDLVLPFAQTLASSLRR
jgi:CubicO group peptidase (beta-lactamase class C family)